MGDIHNELKRGPWGPALASVVGLSRDAAGLERLGETLTPNLDLWSGDRPDWAIERREHLVQLHGFQAAVAAELSAIVFDASTDPNTILIIDELYISGALQVLIGFDARPAGAVESTLKDFRDHRVRAGAAANRRPRSRVWTDSNAATALTGPYMRFTGNAAGTNLLKVPWVVLGDNLSLIVEHGTVNTALLVTAIGRERQLLPSESHDNP